MRLYAALLLLALIVVAYSQEEREEKPQKGKKMKAIKRGENYMFASPMRSRKMGRGPWPTEPFLEMASEETRGAVREIMQNGEMSREEKDKLIEQVLKNERPEVMEEFVRFKERMEEMRGEREREHAERRERLSEGAKKADERLMELFKDESLSPNERRDQMRKVFEQLSDTIKQELRSLRKGKKSEKVAMRIREIGEDIREVHMGIRDAIRSMLGRQGGPMRRLKYPQPAQPTTQLETKSIKMSEDGDFLEF